MIFLLEVCMVKSDQTFCDQNNMSAVTLQCFVIIMIIKFIVFVAYK